MKSGFKGISFQILTASLVFFSLFVFQPGLKAQPHCKLGWQVQPYFCDMDSLILTAYAFGGAEPYSYLWSTGETTVSIYVVNSPGYSYSVTITGENGCTASGTYTMPFNVDPYINASSTVGCENFPIYLDAVFPFLVTPPPGVTYLWSTGQTTYNISVLQSGTYTVTFTDPANGCIFVASQTVNFLPAPEPVITGATQLCGGQSTTLTATGGPFLDYLWIPGVQSTPSINVNTPGTYIVQVQGSNFCYGYDTITVTAGANITLNGVTTPYTSCSTPNGAIDLSVNPSGSYTYHWSNNATTQDINNLLPGNYSVTVTAGGCELTADFTINDNSITPSPNLASTAATCGQNNGSISMTINPPGAYSYNWSNGATTQNLNNINSGTYTVTVTATGGCTGTAVIFVPDNTFIPSISGTTTSYTSCAAPNGSIDISISPAGNYSFLWSNGNTTEDLNNLLPGTYTVTVVAGVSCTNSSSFNIQNLANPPEIQFAVSPASCGENNGTINLMVNGGQAPYSYAWSNGSTNDNLVDIASGNYTVTVTGSNGCQAIQSISVQSDDPVLNISAVVQPNTSCNQSNGEITLTVSPAGNYTYQWSNGSNTSDITNLAAGDYTVTISWGATCNQMETFTVINENFPFSFTGLSNNNTSCLIPNGSIDLIMNPPGSYSFQWSNGQSTEDIQGINAGIYTVTVTNSDGCSISSTYSIQNVIATVLVNGSTHPNTSCTTPNGGADITVSPLGSYSFAWSTGSTNEDLQNVPGGQYSVTVTNTDGCETITSFTVPDISNSISLSGLLTPNGSCILPDGAIDIIVVPAGSYSYQWSIGATTEDISSLTAGMYIITVVDGNGCSVTDTFDIVSSTILPVVNDSITNEQCNAGDGIIDLTTTPPGNTFSWSNGATTEDITNLGSGLYVVTVTSLQGCETIDTFSIANVNTAFTVTGITTENTSCISPNGSIHLEILPAGNYTFQWSTGANTMDINSLTEGIYTVTVSDQSQCSTVANYEIQSILNPPVLTAMLFPETCGLANGSIDISILNPNGNSFTWSTGAVTEDVQNLSAGNYEITVTDSNGCTTIGAYSIPAISNSFTINGIVNDNHGCITPNGSIQVNINPPGNYQISWSNGQTVNSIQQLEAGNYSVTVIDQSGCSSMQSFIVQDQINLPVINGTASPATCGQNDGSIDITVNGAGNYSFLWTNGASTEDLNHLIPGDYNVVVTDANGCSTQSSFTIENINNNFSVTAVIMDDTSCVVPTGVIDLSVTPAAAYTYTWSNGSHDEDLNALASGIYQVTITDPSNCSTTELFTIENESIAPLLSEKIAAETCNKDNGGIEISIIPANGNTFHWSNGQTGNNLVDVPAGIYAVTVTGQNGCTSKATYEVKSIPAVEANLNIDLSGIQANNVVECHLMLNMPISAIDSIAWQPSSMMSCGESLCLDQQLMITGRTEITVTVQDTNGCQSEARQIVDLQPEFSVYIPNVFSPNGDGTNDRFTIFANSEVKEVVKLEIFDRWGNNVFRKSEFPPNEINYGWDGSFKGNEMNPDVFVYQAMVRYSNGEEHAYHGDITLVR